MGSSIICSRRYRVESGDNFEAEQTRYWDKSDVTRRQRNVTVNGGARVKRASNETGRRPAGNAGCMMRWEPQVYGSRMAVCW